MRFWCDSMMTYGTFSTVVSEVILRLWCSCYIAFNNKWKKQITKNCESSFEWHVMAYSMSHIRYVIYASWTEIQCRTFRGGRTEWTATQFDTHDLNERPVEFLWRTATDFGGERSKIYRRTATDFGGERPLTLEANGQELWRRTATLIKLIVLSYDKLIW